MTQPNVQPTETADQPDPFAEIAGALYRIADDLVTLTGSGLPKPSVNLSIQLGSDDADDLTAAAVDATTSALLGHLGQVQRMSNGTYHYNNGRAPEPVGPVGVRVLYSVSAEWALKNDVAAAEAELAEREAEAEKARARVAELRSRNADATGLSYSREPESTVVTPVPAGVDGHPEFSPRGDRSVLLIGRVLAETLTGARPDPTPAHYETDTWDNGPGRCGAKCACGIGYGGTETLAEAVAQLDRHIAAASPDPS